MAQIPNIHSESIDVSSAWQVNSYGQPLEVLKLNPMVATPSITKPTHVLVKVYASSVNLIDCLMADGYGSSLFQILRERNKGRYLASILFSPGQEFPLTLGRDFAGIVVGIGSAVKDVKIGQEVYGFVFAGESGSHADYVLVDHSWIQPKPHFLSFTEAASIPYAAMTIWSSFRNAGGFFDFQDKSFLVLGGSGGVGTIAIQYLKAKGAKVVSTCSDNAFSLVKDLGADYLVDYRDPDSAKQLQNYGPYDCIIDCAGGSNSNEVLPYARRGNCKYITLRSPFPTNVKNYGVVFGGLKSAMQLLSSNVEAKYNYGATVKWGFFSPDGSGWKEIADLVQKKKIKPVVDHVFKYAEIPQAYQKLLDGHSRGKIVIECNPN